MIEEIKQYLRDEIKRQERNWNTDDHSITVKLILDEIEHIEKGWKDRVEEFEATIIKDSYSGWSSWVDDYIVDDINNTNTITFEDIIKKYAGKKVKFTIESLEGDNNG